MAVACTQTPCWSQEGLQKLPVRPIILLSDEDFDRITIDRTLCEEVCQASDFHTTLPASSLDVIQVISESGPASACVQHTVPVPSCDIK